MPPGAATPPSTTVAPAAAESTSISVAPAAPLTPGLRLLELHIGPLEHPTQADGIAELFRDIPGLGDIETLPCDQSDKRVYSVKTSASDTDLLDLLTFHVGKEQINIVDMAAPAAAVAAPTASRSRTCRTTTRSMSSSRTCHRNSVVAGQALVRRHPPDPARRKVRAS